MTDINRRLRDALPAAFQLRQRQTKPNNANEIVKRTKKNNSAENSDFVLVTKFIMIPRHSIIAGILGSEFIVAGVRVASRSAIEFERHIFFRRPSAVRCRFIYALVNDWLQGEPMPLYCSLCALLLPLLDQLFRPPLPLRPGSSGPSAAGIALVTNSAGASKLDLIKFIIRNRRGSR